MEKKVNKELSMNRSNISKKLPARMKLFQTVQETYIVRKKTKFSKLCKTISDSTKKKC